MKKFTFKYFIVFAMLLGLQKLSAQLVANYNFSQSSAAYTPITGATALGSSANDDETFDNIPIGFTFNFAGSNFTQVSVSANGYIKPGFGIVNFAFSPISDFSADDTIISALGADIEANGGNLDYKTIGTAPNQIFVVQWTNYTSFGNSDLLNFQIRLYQTSNIVEVHYGSFFVDVNDIYEVGLRGVLFNNDFNNREVLNFSNTWATSTAGVSSSDFCELDSSPQFAPINGQKYIWSAGACVAPSVTLAASQTTVCANVPVTLTASGATSYSWNTTATSSSISVTPSVTTTYTVTGDNGPTCTDTKTVTINVTPSPVITFSASPSVSLCPGGSATITASGATSYTWSVASQTTAAISVTPGISQAYNVVGTNSLGCSTSSNITIFIVFCTGIDNTSAITTSEIKMYPNPTNGVFTLELANGLSKAIEVMDVTGRIVLVSNTANDKTDLNLSTLANGVYYVRVASNNSVEVLKIVKE